MTPTRKSNINVALATVQLTFALGWTVYVIFLPGLLKQAGIAAAWLPWILIADQLLFAASDLLCGQHMDKVEIALVNYGKWLAALVFGACALFVALPFIADSVPTPLFMVALFGWVALSSVLRVPPLVLLGKAATPDESSRGIAAYLFGLGIAGALAPYLTVALNNASPTLPFVLASAVLMLATLVLAAIIPRLRAATGGAQQDGPSTAAQAPTTAPHVFGLTLFLLAMALFAIGMQLHASFNSARQFRAIAPSVPLEYLMPLFWAGFSVAMYPACMWVQRANTQALVWAGAFGASAVLLCIQSTSLPAVAVLQVLAGAAWGGVFVAALSVASVTGGVSLAGKWLGATFALTALAAVVRIGVSVAASAQPDLAAMTPMLSAACWGLGTVVMTWVVMRKARDG